MRKLLLTINFTMIAGQALAADIQYNMRVDGMTCASCVIKVEKQFKGISGVKSSKIDLDAKIVKVCANDSVKFTNEQLAKLFLEKGFTYRSMEKIEQCG